MANILLVEDDAIIQTTFKHQLQAAGYSVQCAAHGEEAMQLLQSSLPDVMITDIVMPKKSGLTLISEVKEHYPRLPIIAISGGGQIDSDSYLTLCQRLGVVITLQKPFDSTTLLQAISNALDKS